MSTDILKDARILVVEDEYFLATDMVHDLLDAGATVVGPVPTVGEAMEAIGGEEPIEFALLDINLMGEMVYPVADRLIERNIPFAFATGYDSSQVPARFSHVPRCEKPVEPAKLAKIFGKETSGPETGR